MSQVNCTNTGTTTAGASVRITPEDLQFEPTEPLEVPLDAPIDKLSPLRMTTRAFTEAAETGQPAGSTHTGFDRTPVEE